MDRRQPANNCYLIGIVDEEVSDGQLPIGLKESFEDHRCSAALRWKEHSIDVSVAQMSECHSIPLIVAGQQRQRFERPVVQDDGWYMRGLVLELEAVLESSPLPTRARDCLESGYA